MGNKQIKTIQTIQSHNSNNGRVIKISGPLIVADNMADVKLFDVVHVSKKNLIGEIIELRGSEASIQVYEETSGLCAGEIVVNTGLPLSIELAPGIMGGVFDGIGRPLNLLEQVTGSYITRGVSVPALNRALVWDFVAEKAVGDIVETGDILGTVVENEVITHKIMVPYGVAGKITKIASGKFTITDSIAQIDKIDITMLQKWPVRRARPYKTKLTPSTPLITGTRVIDTFFPVAKGGTAAIPGPFGSGKTVIQHQLAKWADADIVVYVGCGERGNEMTDVLTEFPRLIDPRNGQPIMKRTILIANTSDMPVAAREASVYTGITIAEYFRDMGYNVAIMADSTSRWAEALREMSGRLEEMPGEEGYPAYLSSRLAEFYERAGIVKTLGSGDRTGSITAIGAVSPPGGDLSEPVSQATLRIVKVFWGLSSTLAYKRHLPAVDWLTSYSLYADKISGWYNENVNLKFSLIRTAATKLLQEDAFLDEIVRLVGIDAISDKDKLVMETAKTIREDFLQQNAFHESDTFTSLEKQFKILRIILDVHDRAAAAIKNGTDFYNTLKPDAKEKISRFKYLAEDSLAKIDELEAQLRAAHLEEGHSD